MSSNPHDPALILAVPVWRAHAATARDIWKRYDKWALQSVRSRLSGLARDGTVVREVRVIRGQPTAYYWRNPQLVAMPQEATP